MAGEEGGGGRIREGGAREGRREGGGGRPGRGGYKEGRIGVGKEGVKWGRARRRREGGREIRKGAFA